MSSTMCKGPAVPGPDFSAFQRLLKPLFPGVKIQNIRLLEGHSHPLHFLQLSNGLELVLKARPLLSTPVLRHERYNLETEAAVLSLLSQSKIDGIPKLSKVENPSIPQRTSYLLRHSIRGLPLSEIDVSLSVDEQKGIDRRVSATLNLIAQHTSSQFGLVHNVASGAGCRTWKQAFLALLDSLIWDAENLFISLPYPEIRQHAMRLSACLDDVKLPRLVILNIGQPSQAIVDPRTKRVSGFVDFSSALWGDPLMAEIFESASSAFLEGFQSDMDEKSAPIRLLLYSCYHNILRVVRQYYRNREDDEELTARRALTARLAKLSTLEFP
ncbi:hypothetical protein LOZ13_000567 [Ophidiomyces ophidiicola]|nr:hypothetical protein LOZ13_000567 [Ophidiomyces ophidiicola]